MIKKSGHHVPIGGEPLSSRGSGLDGSPFDRLHLIDAPQPRSYKSKLFLLNTLKRPTTWLLAGRAVQLVNSVLLSAILVRKFGLAMVGTFAIGYIAVAFIPQILSLGLNSELPRTRRPMDEIIFLAAIIQSGMFLLLLPTLFVFASLFAHSHFERDIIFFVSLSGCFIGLFNVGLTINILMSRFRSALVAPMIETAVLILGAAKAHSGLQLALFLLASKIASSALQWPRLRWGPVSADAIFPVVKQGAKYLFLDIMVAVGEQMIALSLGMWAPRSQLGLYRLCQQTANAAETPGMSYVQGKYPELTKCNPAVSDQIVRHQRLIGMGAAALCFVGSFPLAFFAFHTPVVALMMSVLSVGLTWRYISYVNDQRLRAEGRITASLGLIAARIVLFATVISLTITHYGVWAGIWTSAVGAVAFGTIYQFVASRPVQRTAIGG